MYDIENRFITTATYSGSFQIVNGEQVIVCNPAYGSNDVVKWMNLTALNFIRIIRFNDEEQAEEEEIIEKEWEDYHPTEEKPADNTNNPAVVEQKNKEEAMFRMEDVSKQVQAGEFKVFLLKDGSVICYNKATGQNKKIHSGGAKDIGLYDLTAGIISIRLSDDTRKRVNLNTGQIVNVEETPKTTPPTNN